MATRRPATVAVTPDPALVQALALLLAPVARLCLAQGVRFSAVEELLKRAFVDAARAAHGGANERDVSRVSAATGLNRREVTRISNEPAETALVARSPATQVFTKWLGSKRLHDTRGRPKALPRQGRAPSFESLARSVTQDVHPRTLLAELVRLGLAEHDERTDTVRLVRDAFAPHEDLARTLAFLGSNVGDHLAAAVDNVISAKPVHTEQAVFADALSEESIAELRTLVAAQWQSLLVALVPRLETLIEADAKAGRVADQRVRVGLYAYHTTLGGSDPEAIEE